MSETASEQTRILRWLPTILFLGLVAIFCSTLYMRTAYGVPPERMMWTVNGEWVEADCQEKLSDCLLKVDDNYLFFNGQHISGVMKVSSRPLKSRKWEAVTRLHQEPIASFELLEDHTLLVRDDNGTKVFNRLRL